MHLYGIRLPAMEQEHKVHGSSVSQDTHRCVPLSFICRCQRECVDASRWHMMCSSSVQNAELESTGFSRLLAASAGRSQHLSRQYIAHAGGVHMLLCCSTSLHACAQHDGLCSYQTMEQCPFTRLPGPYILFVDSSDTCTAMTTRRH